MRIKMTNIIRGFIKSKAELADDDFALMWGIWDWEFRQASPPQNILKMSARDLVKALKGKELTSPSAIGRARRKCQEMYPETRGKTYERRHNEQQHVIDDIRAVTPENDGPIEGKQTPLDLN